MNKNEKLSLGKCIKKKVINMVKYLRDKVNLKIQISAESEIVNLYFILHLLECLYSKLNRKLYFYF